MSRVIVLVIFCTLVFNACAHPQYIPDPVSMAMWTDAPGEPDPLEACHRVTGPGACVVSSARAWAWWMAKWAEREERLEAGEGEE